jgi:hypothetical protein
VIEENTNAGNDPRSTQERVSAETVQDDFSLTQKPSEAHHTFVREVIARTLAKRARKQPHQCVTVKLPYSDYARVTRVREGWELNQTDLIRFFFEMALPILEAPPQDLRPLLEAHRDEVRAQREAEAKKRGRAGLRRR